MAVLETKSFFHSSSLCFLQSLLKPNTSKRRHATHYLPPSNDPHSLHHAIHLSSRHGDTNLAKAIHASLLKHEEDTHLSTALISTYLKLGLLSHAQRLFLSLSSPNVVSYSTLISGLSKAHQHLQALRLFFHMTRSHVLPNEYTYVAVLAASTRILHFQLGLQIHAAAIKTGHLDSPFVANALMSLYAKCGPFPVVLKLFDEMPHRDIASWNTVMSGALQELTYDAAFQLFRDMQASDAFRVDYFTLSILLTACAASVSVLEGQQVHAHAVKVGLDAELNVGNALIGYYAKCGTLDDVVWLFQRMSTRDVITWTEMITVYMEFGLVDLALKVFDDMPEKNSVSYNALLSGFCRNGQGLKAMDLFIKMVEEGLELTNFSLTSGVNACGLLADYWVSKQIHGFAIKFGFGSNACIETALLDMYTRCGRMADAKKMFCRWELEEFRSVAWTSMICGYARNGKPEEAISLFHLGQSDGKVIMDEVASVSMLGLCGTVGHLDVGKQIHCHVLKFGLQSNLEVGNAVVSMYFKCGNVEDAMKIFSDMLSPDIVSWNTLISGNLLHRQGDRALETWLKMQEEGIKPDQVTFVLVISTYRHTNSNLVDDCRRLFNSMRSVFQIEPTSEHYSSFISVLGHWGLLEEALETINKMPFQPSAFVWRALLDGCRLHKNTMIGKWATKSILALEPNDPSTFILVSNLHSASGRWDRSEMVRESMREKGFRKLPAQSWIVCQKKIHTFYARDRSHPQEKDIYSGLEILILECQKIGYEPDTSFVLHEVEEHQKKNFLFYHSSKLAATYGILMTKPGKPIRIVKNVLLCGDCHTFVKYASIVTKRDIFLRDSSGFHCFSNGKCSCRDTWLI
ncbi:pentatricopeptide repeat-containing protein At5g03800 [Abrus precatorius]|uniref:Pentatricopeptide repeat-containing protein At5g03800 n=1 Tax=Abrus precatorius TaxID=3816 RepID=A0A8B8L919_ABRPR|nr:pentatricopeptide repeat-containing protein At5g03800 [Abrus precatorius]